jgi:hypothetical protein
MSEAVEQIRARLSGIALSTQDDRRRGLEEGGR